MCEKQIKVKALARPALKLGEEKQSTRVCFFLLLFLLLYECDWAKVTL